MKTLYYLSLLLFVLAGSACSDDDNDSYIVSNYEINFQYICSQSSSELPTLRQLEELTLIEKEVLKENYFPDRYKTFTLKAQEENATYEDLDKRALGIFEEVVFKTETELKNFKTKFSEAVVEKAEGLSQERGMMWCLFQVEISYCRINDKGIPEEEPVLLNSSTEYIYRVVGKQPASYYRETYPKEDWWIRR